MALEIGNTSVQWVVFTQAFPFHEKDFFDVLFLELNHKLLTNFANHIEGDFLAWFDVRLLHRANHLVRGADSGEEPAGE